MEDRWCEMLRLQAVPHIAVVGDDPLPIEGVVTHVLREGIPHSLNIQIEKLENEFKGADRVEYLTVFYQGIGLMEMKDTPENFQLLLQAYVFNNAMEYRDYNSNVLSAIYTLESNPSSDTISNVDKGNHVNPSDIKAANVNVEVVAKTRSMETDAKFLMKAFLPVQVFYSLTLVPYGGKIARVLLCKHVVAFNSSNNFAMHISRLTQAGCFEDKIDSQAILWTYLSAINKNDTDCFDTDAIAKISEELVGNFSEKVKGYWTGRFYFYIWHYSGKPQGNPNFGYDEYNRRCEESLLEPFENLRFNPSTVFLNYCFSAVIKEIFEWVIKI